jgi:hypothetical protein
MSHRIHALATLAAGALCLGTAARAGTINYDFDSVSGSATPTTLQGATFSSPSDPGAFSFGPNGGLYSTLGNTVLSSAGVAATLDISFASAQTGISFDFANGDYTIPGVVGNGNDTLTLTTNTGYTQTVSATVPTGSGNDAYPQGFFNLVSAPAFTSVTITTQDAAGPESLAIADLTTSPVPLPPGLLLLASGLFGVGALRRVRAA